MQNSVVLLVQLSSAPHAFRSLQRFQSTSNPEVQVVKACLHGMKRPSGHRNLVTIIGATGKTKKRSKRNKKNGQSDDVLVHLSQSPAKMLDMTKQVLEDLGLMKGCAIEAQPTKYKPKAQRAGAVTMGSDCSGLGTERYALRLAGIKVVNKFASEINPHVQAMYQAIHGASDVVQKDAASSPQDRGYVDVYVAGPPCQSWSSMGKRLGLADLKGRGIVFFNCLDYVRKWKPRVVVFENVIGLKKYFANEFLDILTILKDSGYEVTWDELNSIDHGVPQTRGRIYIVAIAKESVRHKFTFAKKLRMPDLDMFLNTGDAMKAFPPPMGKTAMKNLRSQRKKLEETYVNPDQTTCLIDVFASPKFAQSKVGACPCITATRGSQGGFYITNRNRMTTMMELGRLQGWPTKCILRMFNAPGVSRKQVGHSIGNGMTVNVMLRLLPRVLYSAGLIAEKPKDKWKHANFWNNEERAKYKQLPDDMYRDMYLEL